jgi:hypothetical protein
MNARWLRADAWILPEPRLFNEVVAKRVFLQVENGEIAVRSDQPERPRVLAGRGCTFQSAIENSCRISAQNRPRYRCGATTLTKSLLRTRVPRTAKSNLFPEVPNVTNRIMV